MPAIPLDDSTSYLVTAADLCFTIWQDTSNLYQASHLNKQGLLNIVLWEQRKEQSENRTYSEPDTVE